MEVTGNTSLDFGFTLADLKKIKTNIASNDGAVEGEIQEFANLFSTLIWTTLACVILPIILVIFPQRQRSLAVESLVSSLLC
ncbi:TPA: hypothetical protein ACNVBJ_003845 [Klebsiella aerogenes]